ncbi:MAG TPA: phosphate regulon transcriptional regulator PhoB [Usitatibacter sp.]|nr:phosphate regulon transcriptional regulator PhoB [Usitatibacter sp.]
MENTILVVEDDPDLQEVLALNLQNAGYKAIRAGNVRLAEALVNTTLPQLILLDWMLPDMPGLSFARKLRSQARTLEVPIILLTGRDSESDRITGLEAGADDYLIKPFSLRELLSRIKAVMRRCSPQHADVVAEIAGLRLDPASRRIVGNGQDIELGALEFRMLRFFMTHPGRVYSRAQLLDEVWGNNVYVEERTVDVHIRRLRQVLEPTGHKGLLETVRGVGYCFRREIPQDETPSGGRPIPTGVLPDYEMRAA